MPESTGTITLTNGSAAVTGSGTLFADNFVGANDVLSRVPRGRVS